MTYKGCIRNHVTTDIGQQKLSRLRPEDLDRWYSRLKAKGMAPASIRKCPSSSAARSPKGRRWDWVVANAAELASPPGVPKPVVRTPEPDQVRRMLATTAEVDPEFAVYIRLAAVTGARPVSVRAALGRPELEVGRARHPPPGEPHRERPRSWST